MKHIEKTISLPDGREIIIETGRLAKQTDGSVVVKLEGTMLLATAVSSKEAREVDFMPLSVEYREKYTAVGRFPGGFLKRESRPTDDEVLTSRLIDRTLRPLFPKNYSCETVVMVSLISGGDGNLPDALAGLAASAALSVSDIPWEGPISEVRVVRVNGNYIINPVISEVECADLDIMVGATYDNVMMVEGEMDEVSEAELVEAIRMAHDAIKVQCLAQKELASEVNKSKRAIAETEEDEALAEKVKTYAETALIEIIHNSSLDKMARNEAFSSLKEKMLEEFLLEDEELNVALATKYYGDLEKKHMRNTILENGKRLDGRVATEIRPIWGEVGYLPMAHGSAIFTRGETQSLSSITLGSKLDEKLIDGAIRQGKERFMLHYNFPPFCVGEARVPRSVGRREIGHGNLAYRALKRVIPSDFPYSIRLVSDILESNGSSSMATVCAGTMTLMDAGVNLTKPVSGIAMGLISDKESGKYAILSDILGDEDHLGDMDFKVCGTTDGITAVQMDIKIDGLSYEILSEALEQAKQGRLHIMEKILEIIPQARSSQKAHVPRLQRVEIDKEFIGAVIGQGGKTIQGLQEETNTTISIEEVNGKGIIEVFSTNGPDMEHALKKIKGLTTLPEEGEVYEEAKVKTITAFGAFVEFLPGREGLLHISEIEWRRLDSVEEVLKEGDILSVKLLEIDKRTGKFRLSRKALLPKP